MSADDLLNRDELNSLLLSLREEKAKPQNPLPEKDKPSFQAHNFVSEERIVRGRLPGLELVSDRFVRLFRAEFAKHLGRGCMVNLAGIETEKFGVFSKRLALPSNLHLFRMPPLSGQALLVISTPLAFSIVDILFGGNNRTKTKAEGREFSAIETRLLSKTAVLVLDTLREAWSAVCALDFIYNSTEVNPLAISLVPPGESVVVTTISIDLDNESSTMQICIPYANFDPIRDKLLSGFQTTRSDADLETRVRMEHAVMDTKVDVRVELAHGRITPRALLELKIGDVLSLDSSPADQALVYVEGVPKFTGRVGISKGSTAVQITRVISRGGGK